MAAHPIVGNVRPAKMMVEHKFRMAWILPVVGHRVKVRCPPDCDSLNVRSQASAPPLASRPLSPNPLPLHRRRCHRLLQLFKRPHLDLAHAFAADAVLRGEVFQGGGVFLQAAFGENAPFAVR